LGSTGSIGSNTVDIVRRFPDKYKVTALAAGKNVDVMALQIKDLNPSLVSMSNEESAEKLRKAVPNFEGEIVYGSKGSVKVATHPEAEFIMSAIVGAAGIEPTYAAVKAGKTVGLANKETMVAAGRIMYDAVKTSGKSFLPVDSEHSAIFQCLQGQHDKSLEKIYLTSSGGPFRTWDKKRIQNATLKEALNHPVWTMGQKVTIDSSTMMNKGLEVIEARWLFDVDPKDIQIVVHSKSLVHSMVQFIDGSIIAQVGAPDMRGPISYAMAYPERLPLEFNKFNPLEGGAWEFEHPDSERFPAWTLAYRALEMGDGYPAILNAANEIAVESFLNERISYVKIAALDAAVLDLAFKDKIGDNMNTVADVLDLDDWGRKAALKLIDKNEIPEGSIK